MENLLKNKICIFARFTWHALLRGLDLDDLPSPKIGQIWCSRHSGQSVIVVMAGVNDSGKTYWAVSAFHLTGCEPCGPISPAPENYGLKAWRRMLRNEGRSLVFAGCDGLIERRSTIPRRQADRDLLARLAGGAR